MALAMAALAPAPAFAEESRWALLVGIDEYIDPGISRLTGSVNDVIAVQDALVTRAKFPSGQVFLLTSDDPGNEPSTGNILSRLDYIAERADSDDLVYLHFSLHAVTGWDGKTRLLTRRSDPQDLARTALDLDELLARLGTLAAAKRIIVLDGCRNDPEKGRGDQPNALDERFSRALVIKPRQAQSQVAFSQVLFACDVGQRAWEWPGKARGLFSVAVEEALRGAGEGERGDGEVTLAEFCGYVKQRVPDMVALHLKGREQTPQVPEPPAAARAYAFSWGSEAPRITERELPPVPVGPAAEGDAADLEAVLKKKVDKDPTIRIVASPAEPVSRAAAKRLTVRYEAEVDRSVHPKQPYRWRLDDRPEETTLRGWVDLTDLAPGRHVFQVQVQDFWGNWSKPARCTIEVLANRRPEVAFATPAEDGLVEGTKLEVSLTGRDEDGRVVTYRLAIDDPDAFEQNATGTFALPEQADGPHTIFAQAIDDEGAASPWQSRGFRFRFLDPRAAVPPVASPAGATQSGDVMTNPLGMKFKPIPGKPYAMGVYEVTNAQYRAYKPSHDSGSYERQSLNGDTQPVVNVSVVDADAFCAWLTQREPGVTYRLPTEEEWEHACRAGRGDIEFPWGTEWPPRKGAGNYADATAKKAFGWSWAIEGYDDGFAVTSPVGSFEANPWGLHDLGGNVWEWTSTTSGSARVLRGASCYHYDRDLLRVAFRVSADPAGAHHSIGFRVVRQSGSAR